jgi:hypothetical protein
MKAAACTVSFALALAVVACTDALSPSHGAPIIDRVDARPESSNVLSARVQFAVRAADSARISYRSAAGDTGHTPFQRVTGTTGRITVLGLRDSATYSLVLEAEGAGAIARGPTSTVTTMSLPPSVAGFHLCGTGSPSLPYTLITPLPQDTTIRDYQGCAIIFDAAGDVRWYHCFPGRWAIEAKEQRDGNITVYIGGSFGWQLNYGSFEELTPAGDVVRAFTVPRPLYTDPHELLLSFDAPGAPTAHLLGYSIDTIDLTAGGFAGAAQLATHVIERLSPSGSVEFRWRAADHFTAADWPGGQPPIPDLDHPSSLALDRDGNYVVSFQAMDEITKIDALTGRTLWRFGGRHNQFQLVDDPLGGFSGQHDVQVLDNGNLLLMDNHVRSFGPSRAVEYNLDTTRMIAHVVWEYRPDPPVFSPMLGSAQRLPNGATLVGFGAMGRVVETNERGLSWNATLTSGAATHVLSFYRAIGIRSLYGYVP